MKELVKSHDFGIKRSVGINFAVVDEMWQGLETNPNHLRPRLNSAA